MALSTAAGAEAKSQVVALLCPHVLPALLLVPAACAANAVKLDQDAALPLVETLQVHPAAVGAMLVVAYHLLVVVLVQVHRPPEAADQGRGTRGFCGETRKERGLARRSWDSSGHHAGESKATIPMSPFVPTVQFYVVTISTAGVTPDKIKKH